MLKYPDSNRNIRTLGQQQNWPIMGGNTAVMPLQPALDLNFLSGILDSRITASGGTNGRVVNSSGLVVSASTPRFDYNPLTGAPLGILVEEARTNILLYSSDFTNAAWVKTSVSVSANATTAPDGTSTAGKIITSATTAQQRVEQIVTATATAYGYDVFAKAAGFPCIRLENGFTTDIANFDLVNGVVGSATTAATITPFPNNWYRCYMPFTALAQASGCRIYVTTDPNSARGSTTVGNGVGGTYLWGTNFQAGSSTLPASPILTTSVTVTRAADILSMGGSNFSSWYKPAGGTFLAEFDTFALNQNGGLVYTAYANGGNYIGPEKDITGALKDRIVITAGTQANLVSAATLLTNTIYKDAFAFQGNDAGRSLAGASVQTTSGVVLPAPTTLYLGCFDGATEFLNGHLRRLTYYSQRLPNSLLQTLTS